jgi:hypothetical protein
VFVFVCVWLQRVTYVPMDMEAAGTNVAYLGILSFGYLVIGVAIDYLNANPWLRNKLVAGARRAFTSKSAQVCVLCCVLCTVGLGGVCGWACVCGACDSTRV